MMKTKKYNDGYADARSLCEKGASWTELVDRYLELPLGDYRLGWNAFLRNENGDCGKSVLETIVKSVREHSTKGDNHGHH